MTSANRVPQSTIITMKRRAYDALKKTGFEHEGTIFGGFVRDEYISEYYSAKYNKQFNNNTRYWDVKHSPETKARLLMANDMDISFKSQDSADSFIKAVKEIKEFSDICVVDSHCYGDMYSNMQHVLASVKQMLINMRIGHIPFVKKGIDIILTVDVIVPKNPALQPPFNNLDILCNGFIMTAQGGKQFSKNTGTIIDHYSDYERAVVVPQILKHMFEFKSYICMTTISRSRYINMVALQRIKKLMNKDIPWTMLNLPFKVEVHMQEESSEKHDCAICLDAIENNQVISYTTSNKEDDGTEIACGKLHLKCMMHHLHSQTTRRSDNEYIFTFKCPFRNKITFTRCKLDIQFAYKTDM